MRQACLLFSALFLGLPNPGLSCAGEDSPGIAAEDKVLEEVIVAGSRVRRSNLDSPSPVLVIDASSLVDAGITTMGEFTRYPPPDNEMVSDANSGGTANLGSYDLNLRGIGFDGALTPVNGRRIAPFGPSRGAESYVDINAIPVAAIDRIEVLKDGASAIYGSEAGAGVVNISLRDRVEGIGRINHRLPESGKCCQLGD